MDDVHGDGVIQIAADNVTLDGTGVVIQGTGFRGFGIRMNGHSGLTLRNFTIRGFDYGISIENAANVTIEDNDVSGNRKDTQTDVPRHRLRRLLRRRHPAPQRDAARGCSDNTLTDESTGLEVIGGSGNTVTGNLFSEGPEGNETRQDSCWGLRLDGSTENVVRGNVADFVDRERYGLSSGDSAGILLVAGADRNQILGNSFTHSGDGFFLGNSCARESDGNLVSGNDGSFSPHNAFEATFSSGNVFDRNRADHSDYGFWLGYSHDSRVTGNEIAANASAGIAIEHGHGNEIDHNTMTQNPSASGSGRRTPPARGPIAAASCPSADYTDPRQHHHPQPVGLSIENTAGATVTRNRLAENSFVTFRVGGRSPRVIVNNNDLICRPGGATLCRDSRSRTRWRAARRQRHQQLLGDHEPGGDPRPDPRSRGRPEPGDGDLPAHPAAAGVARRRTPSRIAAPMTTSLPELRRRRTRPAARPPAGDAGVQRPGAGHAARRARLDDRLDGAADDRRRARRARAPRPGWSPGTCSRRPS